MNKKVAVFINLILVVSLFLSGCGAKNPVARTEVALDTIVSITIYDWDDSINSCDELIESVFRIINDYEYKFSSYEEGSEIYKVNHSAGIPVAVSDETIDLIEKGIYFSELSGGKFDITSGALNELWDFDNNEGEIPDSEKIEEALLTIDYRNIIINKEDSTVMLKNPNTHIDLGAIAKGFIGDKIKEYMIDAGVKSALINLGGNVVLIGNKNGGDYTIGIPKPFSPNEIVHTVLAKDKTIVTSGNYQRYFEKDGKIFHHIMDLNSGYPVNSGVSSVTIISDESVSADALSTISFILGKEAGIKMLKEYDDSIDSYWIE